jgi:hypothetical protein
MEQLVTIEPVAYTAFENDTDQLEKGKEWGLVSEKAAKMKALAYKRDGKSLPCAIVGYADKATAVIRFDNGQLHSIHPSYLKEMQAASFGKRVAADAENADEAVASATAESTGADEIVANATEKAANADAAVASATAESAGTGESVSQAAAVAAPQAAAPEAQDVPPWDADPADVVPASAPTSPAQPKPEAPKKSKKEKIELPEGKVSLTATVQEFTTVPNHFSDNDDEVIIYEAVSITDPAVELGTAWSSHSATIKKLELAVGDTITFEAKLVAKKLTKHPVPYKINNAAKIQKV